MRQPRMASHPSTLVALGALLAGATACVAHSAATGTPVNATVSDPAASAASLAVPASVTTVQRVTVVNPTSWALDVDLVSEQEGRVAVTETFGPIAAGGRGTGTVAVDAGGTLRVTARWTAAGEAFVSRTYTVVYGENPVTPVTLTLESPDDGLGVWTSVLWDSPTALP